MPQSKIYGFVTRIPKTEREMFWTVIGHEGHNPEGSFLYEFGDEQGWRLPIHTQLDFAYFSARPKEYQVEAMSGRPNPRQRPPTAVEQFEAMAAKTESKKRGRKPHGEEENVDVEA